MADATSKLRSVPPITRSRSHLDSHDATDALALPIAVRWLHGVHSAAAKARRALHAMRRVSAADAVFIAASTVAAAKVALAALLLPSLSLWPVHGWPPVLAFLVFGLSGPLLIATGARDRRARSLGTLYLLIAATFSDPILAGDGSLPAEHLARLLQRLPTDAFLALGLWQFASEFPRATRHSTADRIARRSVAAAAVIGTVLFAANVASAYRLTTAWPWATDLLRALDRGEPTLAYWPVLFGSAAPAIPFLIWKSRFAPVQERQRVHFFVTALAVAITPMLLAVVATPFVPALGEPGVRRSVGWILYTALVSLVPSTAYAVLIHRVLDVQLILRRSIQYALARSTVWLAIGAPVIYLVLAVNAHREMTVAEFLSGQRVIGGVLLFGILALTFRNDLLQLVDRWFLRGSADHVEALTRFLLASRDCRSVRELATLVTRQLARTIHPTLVALLVLDDEGEHFSALDTSLPRLSRRSALVDLLRSVRSDIQLRLLPDSPVVQLLPAPDQQWLRDSGVTHLSPLFGSTDGLLAILALGASRGGLPYTRSDRMLVRAITGQTGMLLENQWLRQQSARERESDSRPSVMDWADEPAASCPQCWLLWPARTQQCSCGSTTGAAALPLVLSGKFRAERTIGVGGMGVVYLGVDLALDRKVAIKALPTISPHREHRLRREARAMATVLHPNLALIFSAEYWRGSLLLIVEYLEGGTLADVLSRRTMSIRTIIELGVVMADVLDRIHRSGILHRDIKPSNIGFTVEGLPKLLDFGLAAMLEGAREQSAPRAGSDLDLLTHLRHGIVPAMTLTIDEHLVGTPLYLSPEAIQGWEPEPSFDLWSLSLVLYEAIAGQHPYRDGDVDTILESIKGSSIPDVRDFRPECPPPVAAFLNDALSRVMRRRPATAEAMRTRLRQVHAELDRA